MEYYAKTIEYTANKFNSNIILGLKPSIVSKNKAEYGLNIITKKKKQGIFGRIFSALKEPMLLILLFGFALAFGSNLGQYLKTGSADFSECFGILGAVVLSVSITLIMEGSSKKAFDALNRIYDNVVVKVIRDGKIKLISQRDVVVGDLVLIESGDKIVADGRITECNGLRVDESALTGESFPLEKCADCIVNVNAPLAERKNSLYSGTFVTEGNGKMLVTSVGDNTEMGKIASELTDKEILDSPLQLKLAKLGKVITIIGASCAVLVFILSVVRLLVSGTLSFDGVRELFISCIILIVAAVPEGLPTIVAVSLALNMIKLAKENALIKKMTATETAGAVSVICTDKTGTLTQNKMSVTAVEFAQKINGSSWNKDVIYQNFTCNSTAEVIYNDKSETLSGNATECALLKEYLKANKTKDYKSYKESFKVVEREPFSSQKKYMTTTLKTSGGYRKLIKGAPEVVLDKCSLTKEQLNVIQTKMQEHRQRARRVICFAHVDFETFTDGENNYVYDGFVAIADPVRPEVFKAVSDCKKAGIKIKILTGDNIETALAIAKELGISSSSSEVVSASQIEKLDDNSLKKLLPKITVIARSTPIVKLRVVKALKSMGEVVAVTGDGINDAPAIKHADVGIAMGINGSEITKEAADVVLLDDSFATVVKAVSFGRNVYRNLQRFILFQLSVNLSALLFITICAIFGMPSPFNTLQLLWINVIMDGPPALTLGLESAGDKLMKFKPVKKEESIVSVGMLFRILFNGLFIGLVVTLQHFTNFLDVDFAERGSAIFTLFILFQLFNAFNSRELGSESIFKRLNKNKIMVVTFVVVFILHFIIVQCFSGMFSVSRLKTLSWLKTIALASSIVWVSEIAKAIFRSVKSSRNE